MVAEGCGVVCYSGRMAYTKTEIARLVRIARQRGHYATGTKGVIEMYCPVHREALIKAQEERHQLPHKFTVYVFPWENPTTVAAVTKALTEHLRDAEINEEPCDRVTVW
jgi:hypothetical protein